jgi:site-specific recombinase XerD
LIWSRIKKLIALDLVAKEQTLYSFRHSAAIAIYSKGKDVALLRELLGHSSITVSLIYLLSIEWGEALVENSLPQLGEDQI